MRVSAVLQDVFCWMLCSAAASTSPPLANEGFSSSAGCVLLTALQFHCLCLPVLPEPLTVLTALQEVFCKLLLCATRAQGGGKNANGIKTTHPLVQTEGDRRMQKQDKNRAHLVVQIRGDRSLGVDPLVAVVTTQRPGSVVAWGHFHHNIESADVGTIHVVPESHAAWLCGCEGLTDQMGTVTRVSGCWRLHVDVGACGGWHDKIKRWTECVLGGDKSEAHLSSLWKLITSSHTVPVYIMNSTPPHQNHVFHTTQNLPTSSHWTLNERLMWARVQLTTTDLAPWRGPPWCGQSWARCWKMPFFPSAASSQSHRHEHFATRTAPSQSYTRHRLHRATKHRLTHSCHDRSPCSKLIESA